MCNPIHCDVFILTNLMLNSTTYVYLYNSFCLLSLTRCKDVVCQCQDLYSMVSGPHPATQAVLNTEIKLQAVATDTNTKLIKVHHILYSHNWKLISTTKLLYVVFIGSMTV